MQFRILFTLDQQARRSSAELSRMYGVTPPTMMKQIALLEKAGLIERAAAANSKHVLQVEMTPQGKRALQDAHARALAVVEDIFSEPGPAELAQHRVTS